MKLQEGERVKVKCTRRAIYANHGHVPREKETVKTLEIISEIDHNLYLVKIKGMYHKGTKIERSARWYVDTCTLSSHSPKPLKYDTEII